MSSPAMLSFADTAAPPVPPAMADLPTLAACIAEQHDIIDARLTRPARWRGFMRRERNGTVRPGEKPRYVQAYDRLTRSVSAEHGWVLDIDMLRAIHAEAVGGWDFREVELQVAAGHVFPPPSSVTELLKEALGCLAQSGDPAPVQAARLHLQLLRIHPFFDGNGRTARLVASLILIRAGIRSTLLTSVEQHFDMDPLEYIPLLDRLQYGEIDESATVAGLLQAMIRNSWYAAWFRYRESKIRSRFAEFGLESCWESVLTGYDLGRGADRSGPDPDLVKAAMRDEKPLHVIIQEMGLLERARLSAQLGRLLDEELEDGAES